MHGASRILFAKLGSMSDAAVISDYKAYGHSAFLRRMVAHYPASVRRTATIFHVSPRFVQTWRVKARLDFGFVSQHHTKGGVRDRKVHDGMLEYLRFLVTAYPWWQLDEFAAELSKCIEGSTDPLSEPTLCRAMERIGYTRKIATRVSLNKFTPENEELYQTYLGWRAYVNGTSLLFLDECHWEPEDLLRKYVWSPRGESLMIPGGYARAADEFPIETRYSVTLCTRISYDGSFLVYAFQRATSTAESYFDFITSRIYPFIRAGDTLVVDGARIHTSSAYSPAIQTMFTGIGASYVILPPYSPELNPCELVFAQVRKLILDETAPTLVERIDCAFAKVSANDVLSYYMHCGYSFT